MKNNALVLFLFFVSSMIYAQKWYTRSGSIRFEASMPAFEEVAAKNNTVSSIFDATTSELAVLAVVKGFRFKLPLMEEHFNENYMETDRFPKATFKGKVLNFDVSKLSTSKSVFDVDGELTMHGVTKNIHTKLIFTKLGDKLLVSSSFQLKTADFKIKIPSIVKSKIAETVTVDLKLELDKKM